MGLRKLSNSPRGRDLIDWEAFREPAFDSQLVVQLIIFLGLYVPYFFIQIFSERQNVMAPSDQYLNQYLVIFLNVGSFFGRLFPNVLADRVGPFNTAIPCALVASAVAYSWIAVNSMGGIITFCLFYGFFSGAYVSLTPVMLASLSPDIERLGTRTGMLMTPMAIGLLIENPAAGSLIRDSSYVGLQSFCGSTTLAAAFFLVLSRMLKTGVVLKTKA